MISSKWLWPRGRSSGYSGLGQNEYQGDAVASGQTLRDSISVHQTRIIIFLLILNLATSLVTFLGQTLSTRTATPQRLLNSPFPTCENHCQLNMQVDRTNPDHSAYRNQNISAGSSIYGTSVCRERCSVGSTRRS